MSRTEQSHGKRRLTKARVSDMGEGAAREQPTTRTEQLRQNATYRASKTATRRSLEAIVEAGVGDALSGGATPAESRLVATNALQLAGDAAREINVASPFVAHHVTRFGINAALSGYFTEKAAQVGFDSERGLLLIDAAHKCEARAERAMVAAEAATKAFANNRRSKQPAVLDLIEARAQTYLDQSRKGEGP